MKPTVAIVVLTLAAAFAGGPEQRAESAAPPRASAGERIESYETRITVQEDGLVEVRETIKVRCEGRKIKRGIYRDIPTVYPGPLLTRKTVSLQVLGVLRDGKVEGYHVEAQGNGKRIYIGRSNVYLKPGTYTYTLTYTLDRQLGFFEDHDELYFNAIGTGWDFAIKEGTASVILPPEISRDRLELTAYTGRQGSRGKDYEAYVSDDGLAVFRLTRVLQPKEGLSVVVGWPKGYIKAPSPADRAAHSLRDNLGTVIGLFGLLFVGAYYMGAWIAVGVDPARGLIIPRFKPPEGFSPAAVRYLMEMGYDNRCLTAAVINMAVKGHITIKEEDGEYTLAKTGENRAALSAEEKKVASALLSRRSEITLEQKEHKRVQKAIAALKTALGTTIHGKLFFRNSAYLVPAIVASALALLVAGFLTPSGEAAPFGFMLLWLSFWTLGCVALVWAVAGQWRIVLGGGRAGCTALGGALGMTLFALPFLAGEVVGLVFLVLSSSVWVALLLVLMAALHVTFYHLLKAPTQGGRRIMDEIEGFRMYLGTAERHRLDALHAPERTPELFERYLPYAVALEVENRWAEQFADVLMRAATEEHYSPSWYVGTGFRTLGPTGFTSSVAGSFSGAIASASTAPGSSSGGGGGGFSGGGGGGGGGGGW